MLVCLVKQEFVICIFQLKLCGKRRFFCKRKKNQARFDSFAKRNVTDFNHEKQIFSDWVTRL